MIDAGGIGRQLKGFIEGFNSSPQPFFMVEVVSGGGATESKMQGESRSSFTEVYR